MSFDISTRVDKLLSGLQKPQEYRGPSWSWISTKAYVAFWTKQEIAPHVSGAEPRLEAQSSLSSITPDSRRRAGRNRSHTALEIMSCIVKTDGRNPYGEVSSAILVVRGVLKEAKVWDDAMVIPDSLVPPSFEVEIRSEDRCLRLSFFADYILSSDGPYQVKTSDSVFLLEIAQRICLVLSKTSLMFAADTSIYRRIGILKVPYEIEARYGIDVMGSSERTKVAIV